MRGGRRKAGGQSTDLKDSGCKTRRVMPQAIGLAAILWIAAGAFVQQRPLARVQSEARMMQMAGQAVARRSEKKTQESERPATKTETRAVAKTRRIVVSIPDRKLALIENDSVMKIYAVAVGTAETPSPEGEFLIASRVENPSWYWPGKVIPAGPQNPLGPRWMGLGAGGFGIHGTNQPRTIGQSASHGCIRLRNRDVKDLFRRVRVGDVVELHGERDAAVALIFGTIPGGATRGGVTPEGDVARAPLATAAATGALDAKFVTAGAHGAARE